LHFLRAQTFPNDIIAALDKFDFSATEDIEFIHSIPGTYNDEEVESTGLPLLSTAIKTVTGEGTVKKVEVDFATSSLGALDETQVDSFIHGLRGDDPHAAFQMTTTSSASGEAREDDKFRIIFPSNSTVRGSKGGVDVRSPVHRP